MNNAKFKSFLKAVKTVDSKDPLWWAGYLWIDLTPLQCIKTMNVLQYRKDCKIVFENGKNWYMIPSGLKIALDQREFMKK